MSEEKKDILKINKKIWFKIKFEKSYHFFENKEFIINSVIKKYIKKKKNNILEDKEESKESKNLITFFFIFTFNFC